SDRPASPMRPEAREGLPSLPLSFESNLGQTDPGIRFLARGAGYDVALTEGGAVFALGEAAVEMDLVGASLSSPRGVEPLPGTVNYLLSDDPSAWTTGVPTFGEVQYPDVYPGIDLVFRGRPGGGLEYDLVLDPGTDPSLPMLRFRGAQEVSLRPDGDLAIQTASGTLLNGAPRIWQPTAGGRLGVRGAFQLAGNAVRFAVGSHNPALPLVIDPPVSLAYSTFLGGGQSDQANAIAVDAVGSAYVTGETEDGIVDFPTTPGAYDTGQNGDEDVFVAKLSPGGDALVYSTFLGGGGSEQGLGIAVDQAGSAYVTGAADVGFPTTPGAYDTSHNSFADAFVAKLSPDGSALAYSTFVGSGTTERGHAIAVDLAGSAYITGGTGPTFPTTPGAYDTVGKGGADVFATKLTPGGDDLAYSTFLGGSDFDQGLGITVDGSGAAYVTGGTRDAVVDFPTTPGAFDTTNNGEDDVFATKLSPGGDALAYSTFLGGSDEDEGFAIAIDTSGAAFLTGFTVDAPTDFPTIPGAFDTSINGADDAFVTKLDPAGSAMAYSTLLGGDAGGEGDVGRAVAVDTAGAAHITGSTADAATDFPTTPGAFDTTHNGNADAFVTTIARDGSSLMYSTLLGSDGNLVGDAGRGIAVDGAGATYVAGETQEGSVPFPTTVGAYDTTHNGERDGFVAKLSTMYECRGKPTTLLGGPGKERLTGTGAADVVLAGGGNDRIKTVGGADVVCAGSGKDTAAGGGGKDRLLGEGGKDLLKGQGGKDRHVGGPGRDTCIGGGGRDRATCEIEKKVP
ncbi:MAG: hypothetical protein ACRDHB_09775, partial [Actinomycetota bacterium]